MRYFTLCVLIIATAIAFPALSQPCKPVLAMRKNNKSFELHANKPDTILFELACVSGCKVLVKPVDSPGISITKVAELPPNGKSASATFLIVARQKGSYNVEVRASCPKGKKTTGPDGTTRDISGSWLYAQTMIEVLE